MKLYALCAAVAAAATPAFAETPVLNDRGPGRVYLGLGLGIAVPTKNEQSFSSTISFFDPLLGEQVVETSSGSNDVISSDIGAGASFFVGFRINEHVAIELESSARAFAEDDHGGDSGLGTGLLSVNAILSGSADRRLIPYVGVGIGQSSLFAYDDGDNEVIDERLGYQVKAGLILPVGEHHGFGLEAAFVQNGDFASDFMQTTDPFPGSGGVPNTLDVEEDIFLNSLDFKLTYRFQFGGWGR